jgi:hypothetical protein
VPVNEFCYLHCPQQQLAVVKQQKNSIVLEGEAVVKEQ